MLRLLCSAAESFGLIGLLAANHMFIAMLLSPCFLVQIMVVRFNSDGANTTTTTNVILEVGPRAQPAYCPCLHFRTAHSQQHLLHSLLRYYTDLVLLASMCREHVNLVPH